MFVKLIIAVPPVASVVKLYQTVFSIERPPEGVEQLLKLGSSPTAVVAMVVWLVRP